MEEHKRMRQRSGTYAELEASSNSLLQDEMLVVESGDPNTTTGRGLYMCYPEFYGSRKERLRFASEELSADDIAEGSITNDLLHDDSVDTNNIIDGSITPAKFASSVGFGSGYSFICSNTGEIVAYSTGTSTITAFQPSGYTVPANYYVWLDKGVNSISSSALTRDSSHVLSRIYAENENVDLSGLDTTGVTVTRGFNKKYKQFILSSLSLNAKTVNSILSDIATLNAKFPIDTSNIKDNAVTTNKLAGSAVTTSKIYPNAVTENKIANGSVATDKLAGSAVTSEKIGSEEVKTVNIKDGNVTESKIANGAVTSNKLYTGAVNSAKIDTGAVTENKIANNAVSYAKLSSELQGTIDGKADLTDLDELLRYSPHTINAASELNVSGYASEYGRYGLKLVGSAANSFGVESGTLAEMKVIGAGEVSAQNPFIRVLEFPQISGLKWYQEVTSIGQTFTAGSWIKNDVKDNVLLNPDYSIGFASDGTVITRANVTDIGAGGISNSNVRSIYVASKVTSISSSIISATIGLTTDTLDLYVDNSQDNINIASEVLSDSRITIHYKGSFSVIDLLSNSQLHTNSRLTTLEGNISGLINGDEVSY